MNGPAFAGGFALYEGSVRANALGGSVIAKADDPGAIFFNPAGITQLPGTQTAMGVSIIMPSTHITTEQYRPQRGLKTEVELFRAALCLSHLSAQ